MQSIFKLINNIYQPIIFDSAPFFILDHCWASFSKFTPYTKPRQFILLFTRRVELNFALLLWYCDEKSFFFCDYYRNHYGFANSTRLSTTSFMVYIVRRRWTLTYVCERGSRLSLPQCLLDYFFGLFSNVLWLVVLFQGGISFNPRVLYTVPATLWL